MQKKVGALVIYLKYNQEILIKKISPSKELITITNTGELTH